MFAVKSSSFLIRIFSVTSRGEVRRLIGREPEGNCDGFPAFGMQMTRLWCEVLVYIPFRLFPSVGQFQSVRFGCVSVRLVLSLAVNFSMIHLIVVSCFWVS